MDLLRIVATVAVILIHINWYYFGSISESPQWTFHYVIESFINIITRFSVPVFVMISGYFNLKNPQNGNPMQFYKKSIHKIGFPVLFVIVLFAIGDLFDVQQRGTTIIPALQSIFNGTYYNLWFIYMLFGCYFLTPVIMAFRNTVSFRFYKGFTLLCLLWACFSQTTSIQTYSYSIGVVGAFLTYYMYGDVLRISQEKRLKSKMTMPMYGLMATICVGLTFYGRWKGNTYYLSAPFTNFFSPTIMIYSICIMKIFLK